MEEPDSEKKDEDFDLRLTLAVVLLGPAGDLEALLEVIKAFNRERRTKIIYKKVSRETLWIQEGTPPEREG